MKGIKLPIENIVHYLWNVVQEYEIVHKAQLYTILKKIEGISKNGRRDIVNSVSNQIRVFTLQTDVAKYLTRKKNIVLKKTHMNKILCFWVLLDYLDQVDEHFATGTYSQISMIIDCKDYDIVYVTEGEELLCLSHIKNNGESGYIVVLENKKQIQFLQDNKIKAFATVTPFGKINYYGLRR